MCKLVDFNGKLVADIKLKHIENIIKQAEKCNNISRIMLFGSSIEERCNDKNQQSLIFAHYIIPATPDNFSRLMQIADMFSPNFTFTIQFEGRLKKVVFLKRNEKLLPHRA